jgi:hypothetical protein
MKTKLYVLGAFLATAAIALTFGPTVHAQEGSDFAIQVSPSPLVTTLKPGQSKTLELNVRNQGTHSENLKIQPRGFIFDSKTQKISIDDTKAPPAAQWLKFSNPTFSLAAGQTTTERVTISLPKEAGFSYSFALVIARAVDQSTPQTGRQQLKGSLALFTLVNVDRPGATRKLELGDIKASKNIYEYLPAQIDIELKNTGNSIFQPLGNVFIQRGLDDKKPIDTLSLNQNNAYILPGTTRIVRAEWTDGFQVEKTTTNDDGNTKKEVVWDWSNLSHLRIGKYTAKVVALYNDGQRDIPLEGTVSFWVMPWKIMLGALVVILLIGTGLWSFVSKAVRLGKRVKRRR